MIALSPNYYLFALGRFLIGFFVPGGITTFILLCEVTAPSRRSLLAVSQAAVFGLGYGVMALFAYLLPNWRWFTASIAVMSSVFIFVLRSVSVTSVNYCYNIPPQSDMFPSHQDGFLSMVKKWRPRML